MVFLNISTFIHTRGLKRVTHLTEQKKNKQKNLFNSMIKYICTSFCTEVCTPFVYSKSISREGQIHACNCKLKTAGFVNTPPIWFARESCPLSSSSFSSLACKQQKNKHTNTHTSRSQLTRCRVVSNVKWQEFKDKNSIHIYYSCMLYAQN